MFKLPVIDYNDLKKGLCNDKLHKASTHYGAFFLEGHGITEESFDLMLKSAEDFFNKPKKLKTKYSASKNNYYLGYRPIGFEVAKGTNNVEVCEQYKLGFMKPGNQGNRLRVSDILDSFDYVNVFENYWEISQVLGNELLSVIANNLELGDKYFEKYLKQPMHQIGINKYPLIKPDNTLSTTSKVNMSSHTDMSLFTMQFENTNGLEILVNGKYQLIEPPKKSSLIIMIGEYIDQWSEGKYKAVQHRVHLNDNRDRVSINYKHRPDFFTVIPSSLNNDTSYVTGSAHEEKLNEICRINA